MREIDSREVKTKRAKGLSVSRDFVIAISDGQRVTVQLTTASLAKAAQSQLNDRSVAMSETWQWLRQKNELCLEFDAWKSQPEQLPKGEAKLPIDTSKLLEFALSLRDLLRSPEVWQPVRVDPTLVKQGIEAIDRLASLPSVSAVERSAIQAALQVCEQYIEGTLVPALPQSVIATPKRNLSASIIKLEPDEFFSWFDQSLPTHSRNALQAIMKSWVAEQAGKHAFDELPSVEAVAKKHSIARGIQKRLEQVGMVIQCGHIAKLAVDPCGAFAKLNALKKGSSVSGQYLLTHQDDHGKTSLHMLSKRFPRLKLVEDTTIKG